jgi:hypothetical protein
MALGPDPEIRVRAGERRRAGAVRAAGEKKVGEEAGPGLQETIQPVRLVEEGHLGVDVLRAGGRDEGVDGEEAGRKDHRWSPWKASGAAPLHGPASRRDDGRLHADRAHRPAAAGDRGPGSSSYDPA